MIDEYARVIDQHAPVAAEHGRVIDEYARVVDRHAPVADEHARVADQHGPGTDQHAPGTDQHAPVTEQHAPVADEHTRVADQHALATHEHARVADGHAQGADGPARSADGHARGADEHAWNAASTRGWPMSKMADRTVESPLSHDDHILAVDPDRVYVAGMPLMTADELLRTSLPNKRSELVRGVLVVREPAGGRHGHVTARLTKHLMDVVDAGGLGSVFAAETGFLIGADPDTVRAPDIAFVSRERLPDTDLPGYPALAPDLVVEVASPGDRPGEILAKVSDWLNAGARLVWVVDPVRRQARVYRADGSETVVAEADALEGEDVVAGFSCLLGEIF